MSKVFILNGSPRSGSTERLVEKFAQILKNRGHEVEVFNLSKVSVSPCTECLSCFVREGCIVFDGMQAIYDRLKRFEVVFFATPIFFSGPSAQLKAAIDRLEAFWALKYIHKKKVREDVPQVFSIVVGSRNSQLDLKTTETILKAACTTFNGKYGGSFAILNVETYENLPEEKELLKNIEKFIVEAGL